MPDCPCEADEYGDDDNEGLIECEEILIAYDPNHRSRKKASIISHFCEYRRIVGFGRIRNK